MAVKWVFDLPESVKTELMTEARAILTDVGYKGESLEEALHDVENEKLINVIGSEYGLLDYEKYSKYLFDEVRA